jgi:hypothetical protein
LNPASYLADGYRGARCAIMISANQNGTDTDDIILGLTFLRQFYVELDFANPS